MNQTYRKRGVFKKKKRSKKKALPVEGSEGVWGALVLFSVMAGGETVVDFEVMSLTVDSVVFTGMLVVTVEDAEAAADGVAVVVVGLVGVVAEVLVVLIDGVGVGKVMMVVVVG